MSFAAVLIGALRVKEDSNTDNLKGKPSLNHTICHKSNQNGMKGKQVTDDCIVEN